MTDPDRQYYMRLDASPEEMLRRGREAHAAAKALQQKLKTETAPESRKRLARQRNGLFREASLWTNRVKHLRAIQGSVEREYMSVMSHRLCHCLIAFFLCTTATIAQQPSAYEHVKNALEQVEIYKTQPKRIKSAAGIFGYDDSQWLDQQNLVHYLGREESERMTEQNGVTTYFAWDGGLCVDYDVEWLFHSWPFQVAGVSKSRPTGSVTYQVTQQGITIKFYNDVQYNCDFDKRTGMEKPHPCPFTAALGCKTGSRVEDTYFVTWGGKKGKFKANVSCQHSHVQLKAGYGSSQRYNPWTGVTEWDGGGGDPYSPWKYKHTVTVKILFSTLAQSAGMSRQEFLKEIVRFGFRYLTPRSIGGAMGDEESHSWTLEPLNNILTYKFLKEAGYTLATLKEECEREEAEKQERQLAAERERRQQELVAAQALIDSCQARARRLSIRAQDLYRKENATTEEFLEAMRLCDSALIYTRLAQDKSYEIKDTLRNVQVTSSLYSRKLRKLVCAYYMHIDDLETRAAIEAKVKDFRDSVPPSYQWAHIYYKEMAEANARHGDYASAVEQMKESVGILQDTYTKVPTAPNDTETQVKRQGTLARFQQQLATYYYERALQTFAKNWYESTYHLCVEAMKGHFQDVETWEILGLMIMRTGSKDKKAEYQGLAIKALDEILKIDPNYAQKGSEFYKMTKKISGRP